MLYICRLSQSRDIKWYLRLVFLHENSRLYRVGQLGSTRRREGGGGGGGGVGGGGGGGGGGGSRHHSRAR